MNNLYIYGGGNHAKVIIDIANALGIFNIPAALDDNEIFHGRKLLGVPVTGSGEILEYLTPGKDCVFIAIGNNNVRLKLGLKSKNIGLEIPVLIHPKSVVAPSVTISEGTAVMAGVVVNPDAKIGSFGILNTSCSIDHDCILGDSVHVSPGAHLAGGVEVGDETHIGIGSSVIEGVKIGKNCIIGGGSVVIRDIPDNTKVVGVPAHPIKY